MPKAPDFREISAIEERALSARLDAVRATIETKTLVYAG